MCAAQLDELPENNDPTPVKAGGLSLVAALIAVLLAPSLTVGAMLIVIKMNKPVQAQAQQETI